MSSPISTESRYMKGAYAPVKTETTEFDLPVTGTIPPEFNGRYLRNGPNLIQPDGRENHFFAGDGMVHGVSLRNGKAEWYRSRWVRHYGVTRQLGEPPRKAISYGGMDQPPNTHVLDIAGKTYALVEAGTLPYALTDELETIGTDDFGGTLPCGYTAHPHTDPVTGLVHAINYTMGVPTVTHIAINQEGRVVTAEPVSTPHMPMMHDFALTENYAAIFDLPVGFSIKAVQEGAFLPYVWDENHQSRVGLLPLKGSASDIRWFDIPSMWTYHFVNAYETGSKVVFDFSQHPKACANSNGSVDNHGLPWFGRLTIDLDSGAAELTRVDDRPLEFPRINDRVAGRPYRYAYAVTNKDFLESQVAADEVTTPATFANRILKYDMSDDSCIERVYPESAVLGEPVFVEATNPESEDHGYLIFTCFDADRGATDLVILDALDINKEPVAAIHLPVRVPIGFHGSFVPYK